MEKNYEKLMEQLENMSSHEKLQLNGYATNFIWLTSDRQNTNDFSNVTPSFRKQLQTIKSVYAVFALTNPVTQITQWCFDLPSQLVDTILENCHSPEEEENALYEDIEHFVMKIMIGFGGCIIHNICNIAKDVENDVIEMAMPPFNFRIFCSVIRDSTTTRKIRYQITFLYTPSRYTYPPDNIDLSGIKEMQKKYPDRDLMDFKGSLCTKMAILKGFGSHYLPKLRKIISENPKQIISEIFDQLVSNLYLMDIKNLCKNCTQLIPEAIDNGDNIKIIDISQPIFYNDMTVDEDDFVSIIIPFILLNNVIHSIYSNIGVINLSELDKIALDGLSSDKGKEAVKNIIEAIFNTKTIVANKEDIQNNKMNEVFDRLLNDSDPDQMTMN